MTTIPSKNYLKYIAYAQVIGILLVVLGHSLHLFPENNGEDTLAYRMIYNFHMPLFVFVSGFLMRYTSFRIKNQPPALSKFVVSKLKRLIVPLVFISLILFVPRHFMSEFADDATPLTLHEFLVCWMYGSKLPIPFFWFLHFIFLTLLLSFPMFLIGRRRNCPMWASYLLIVTIYAVLWTVVKISDINTDFFSLYLFNHYFWYFLMGCLFCDCEERFTRLIKLESWGMFLGLVALWCIFFFLGSEVNKLFAYVATLFGIFMCISLSKLIETSGWTGLDRLTGASYLIYLLSWFANVTAQQLLAHFVDWPWWVHTILSFSLGVFVPWLIYVWLTRHQDRRFPRAMLFLLGHPVKKVNK